MADEERNMQVDMGADGAKVVKVNYPGNSKKAKAAEPENRPKKEIKKLVTGEVVHRKKSLGRKIADTFTDDAAKNTGEYLLFDVAIPAFKNLIADMVGQGIERALFGEVRSRRSSSSGRGGGTINYSGFSKSSSDPRGRAGEADGPRGRDMSYKARANHDFGEIILDTRGEAEDIIDGLSELIKNYDVASVAELYSMLGITSQFTDNKWGWDDIRGAKTHRVRDGYLLELPRPIPLD